ncbi:L,D-peptidoglycan transpeptidase YkuD, ErfK/YbiS/YcfS/YnhG family [Terrimicrobium sacchariphilum]|uniref:L,D-peptidoglycan transpeptidase YkuD, ErfK/YbiS/YcfS/YnhG family n=1 Tax=Terrimicrobium sacchariphilum TaxID=690879 RepID=A0A146G5Z2_TERSA|nr:L,D-transpeptidase family protein [Terrimicrobium sacchariphilum]GAT32822.1 L,D-peptidoglycan transpeptidase YkuD, ErfK/YbiS/YcfS/YnhG family [Terrimicrobium sacchariphilum]
MRLLLLLLTLAVCQPVFALDSSVRQLIVSIAPTWDSSVGKLQLFERQKDTWMPVGEPVRVLYGKNGLAWGKGELGQEQQGIHKAERDKRAPAGVFALGTIYTYDKALPDGASYPFHTITAADAWVDDPLNPLYNQHVVIDPANPPPWFEKQKMRLDDPPHRWLVEIRHNSDPPVPGAGSAIFFHIQRGPDRPSAGCTVMTQPAIVRLIRWLRKGDNPHYVLLPREEYLRLWKTWGLPDPKTSPALFD